MKIVTTKTLSKNDRGTFTIKMRTDDNWTEQKLQVIARVLKLLPPTFQSNVRWIALVELVAKWEGEEVAADIKDAFE